MPRKKITIEDLARITKKGFDEVYEKMDKRFAETHEIMNKRFEIVDKRFEEINQRFELIDKRFEAIDRRFDLVDKRLEKIEAQIDQKFDKLITTLDHFLKRMTDLEDEFTIMKHDLSRVKKVIKEKLGVDLT